MTTPSEKFLDKWKRTVGARSEGRGERDPKRALADETPARIFARVSARALVANYRAIQALVPDQALLPMVKANAYGHGAQWAVRVLRGEKELYGFGVATLEEAVEARDALGPTGRKIPVLVFSGTTPWTEAKGELCESYALTPVITSDADFREFVRGGWPARVSYELKFNTGLNRLGMSLAGAREVVRLLAKASRDQGAERTDGPRASSSGQLHPSGVFSHLASSEAPDSRLSQLQLERFAALKAELSGAFPATRFHLANSGGIWNQKRWGLSRLTDVVRPGLSLYGVSPWADAPVRGLEPVLTVEAPVVAIHRLAPGESVGYGATFKAHARGNEPTWVATLAAGYADGIHRSLGNQGFAWLNGRATRFAGAVSMDLCSVIANEKTKVGDFAELWGAHVDAWAQARAAGTIPYELLTSLSPRVQRSYD